MRISTIRMTSHATELRAPSCDARVVASCLGSGESLIGASQPSIKLLLEGEEVYRVEGRTYRLTPGCMLFVDRGEALEATIRQPSRTRGLCIYLPQEAGETFAARVTPLLGRTSIRSIRSSAHGEALMAIATAVHRNEGALEASAVEIVTLATAVMHATFGEAREQMARLSARKPSTRANILNRLELARAHLHDNLHRNVSLSELAEVCGLSAFHLARYFRAALGVPPGRYHRTLRMGVASSLIRADQHSLTEIAELTGYSELSAFSHAFRREFGVAPSNSALP